MGEVAVASGIRTGKIPYLVKIRGIYHYERDFDKEIQGKVVFAGKALGRRVRKSLSTSEQSRALLGYTGIHLTIEKAIEEAWKGTKPPRRRVSEMGVDDILDGLAAQFKTGKIGGTVDDLIANFEATQYVELSPQLRNKFHDLAITAARSAVREMMVGLNFNPAIIGAGNFIDSNPDRAAPLAKIVSLKDAIEKFKSNPERQELASSNITNYSTICDVILETLGGNANIAYINRDDIIRVREIIRYLPANAKENSAFSGLTYEDISRIIRREVGEIKLESEKDEIGEDDLIDAIQGLGVLKISTINKYLTNMGTVFEFFRVNGWVPLNPAEKIKLNDGGYQSIREAFPDEKLIKLFNCKYNFDGVGWLPYLALYHGMRGNELAQLDVTDVVQEDGVWCFNVSPSVRVSHLIALSKTVKNKKPRFVPIHSRAIERGFLDYVESRRAGGTSKVFDATKIKSGNYLTSLASQIDEILAPVKSPQHTLHSFRHNFAQRAELVMEDSMLKTLGGWSLPKSADERYKKGIPVSHLKQEIEKIVFPV